MLYFLWRNGRHPMTQQLWQADPHQFGPGKTHIVDSEDEGRTYCGKRLNAFPGRPSFSGTANCQICVNAVATRKERKKRTEEWIGSESLRKAIEEESRRARSREWWEWYNKYLQSDEWRHRRYLVMKRCHGQCEGCACESATQVHHITYEHVGNELLWELKAVCNRCHERAHPDKEAP